MKPRKDYKPRRSLSRPEIAAAIRIFNEYIKVVDRDKRIVEYTGGMNDGKIAALVGEGIARGTIGQLRTELHGILFEQSDRTKIVPITKYQDLTASHRDLQRRFNLLIDRFRTALGEDWSDLKPLVLEASATAIDEI